MDPGETGRLLCAARSGAGEDRELLLERLRPRLVLWASARMSPRLRSRVEPDDVAQEVLLAVHEGIGSFQGPDDPGAFLGWVFRIAENRIRDLVDHFEARKRQPRPLPAPPSQTSPSRATARAEQFARIRRAMEALPEDYRLVIRLRRLEELDTPLVAEAMERSENAVRVLYFRALEALRAELGDEDAPMDGRLPGARP